MLELQCTKALVLELLRTLMLCLVQLSKKKEKARPQMLKSFFLRERKLVNAIIRVKLKYMKDVSFSWNEMLFTMQKTNVHVLELFCRASHVRASMHKSTSFRATKNTNALFSATKQKEEKASPQMLKSFFLSKRKLVYAIIRVKLKYMKDVSFSWNEMLFAMQKTYFHVFRAFCRASHVRTSMHKITSLELLRTLMLRLVQLSKKRESKATDAEKLLSQR